MPTFYIYFKHPSFGYVHSEKCESAEECVRIYYEKHPNATKGALAQQDSDMDAYLKGSKGEQST